MVTLKYRIGRLVGVFPATLTKDTPLYLEVRFDFKGAVVPLILLFGAYP